MRNLQNYFNKRKIDYTQLNKYGFKKEAEKYVYNANILVDQFAINISISEAEQVSKLIDLFDNSEYALADVEEATGEFVGKVRDAYESIIEDVIEKCTSKEIFKAKQTKEITEYIKQKYNDELEFLWEKFDDTAIWRNKETAKWYGLIMTIPENKISGTSDRKIEALDLHYQKEKIDKVIDNKTIFPGYHMNKKSWITIKLDGSVDTKKICELIDNSYELSRKKSK